jgi:hypothetical protein
MAPARSVTAIIKARKKKELRKIELELISEALAARMRRATDTKCVQTQTEYIPEDQAMGAPKQVESTVVGGGDTDYIPLIISALHNRKKMGDTRRFESTTTSSQTINDIMDISDVHGDLN